MSEIDIDQILRLVVAAIAGIAIGLNRELRGKPLGMRTLALVSLGSAIAVLTATHFPGLGGNAEALSRVIQGAVQGVLTGIGFIGAGVVLRDRRRETVHGLTTAATVWVAAALGVACAVGAWTLVTTGVVLTLVLLFGLGRLEAKYFAESDPGKWSDR